MAADKSLFAPLPLRAMADDLSGLDLRVLLCVAAHDRMSIVTGKGQGCRASNQRMAEMIGCSYARLCTTLTGLTEQEYLTQEKLGRHTVYRVVYTDADRLLFSNVSGQSIGCRSVRETGVTGCQHTSDNGEIPPETAQQYIPLNGGIDSVETGEDNSSEEARLAARRLSRIGFVDNLGGQLAKFERNYRNTPSAFSHHALFKWYEFLSTIVLDGIGDESERGRAERLLDDINWPAGVMDEDGVPTFLNADRAA